MHPSKHRSDHKTYKNALKLPVTRSLSSRHSTMTNAYVNALLPVFKPTSEQIKRTLEILCIDPNDLRCSYCGDRATEWDHLHPTVKDKQPTGYITEIGNLVPSCGKCNQSKGNSEWKTWIRGTAELSPTNRAIEGIEIRIQRLMEYEKRCPAIRIDVAKIVDNMCLKQHWNNYDLLIKMLKEHQQLASTLCESMRKIAETKLVERT